MGDAAGWLARQMSNGYESRHQCSPHMLRLGFEQGASAPVRMDVKLEIGHEVIVLACQPSLVALGN